MRRTMTQLKRSKIMPEPSILHSKTRDLKMRQKVFKQNLWRWISTRSRNLCQSLSHTTLSVCIRWGLVCLQVKYMLASSWCKWHCFLTIILNISGQLASHIIKCRQMHCKVLSIIFFTSLNACSQTNYINRLFTNEFITSW